MSQARSVALDVFVETQFGYDADTRFQTLRAPIKMTEYSEDRTIRQLV